LTVRYRPVYPVACIALGIFDLVLGFFLIGETEGVTIALSSVIPFAAAAQMRRTYFEFDPLTCTIAFKRGIGEEKRFGGANGELLLVDGDRIFRTTAGGARKRVPLTRFLARAEQWRAVVELIRHAPVTGPAPL
jgi:hypothetical protein